MAVKSLLSFGHRVGAISVGCGKPFELKAATQTLHARIMSEADTLRMIHGFQGQPRDVLILLTLYATGARASEICSMSWATGSSRIMAMQSWRLRGRAIRRAMSSCPPLYGLSLSSTEPRQPILRRSSPAALGGTWCALRLTGLSPTLSSRRGLTKRFLLTGFDMLMRAMHYIEGRRLAWSRKR